MNDGFATLVIPDAAPAAPKPVPRAALARLAFGSVPSSVAAHTLGPRHLAFLPPESLELDLSDPAQRTFGDYELIDKLGQGGMGVVYRARQRSLEREVALKLLSAGPWASKDFIERFRREAQSAARMQHPNIVAIYEIGAQDELNFFSMRLVQGVSLAHQLQESGPLPPRRAAQLMRTIAEALDYAHRLGVLHLDLKPANVLIDERGEPQVADFGLARRLDETLTRDNDEVSGTPSYMAPEQAQIKSHKLSQATDIYGLGAILYELLTGRPPFLGSTPQDTLQRVISETPTALRQYVPGIAVDLEAICLKCLAKEPGERYLSARALAEDLGRFVEGRPVSVRPLNTLQRTGRWARREPHLAASVAVAALALIVGLIATTTQWRRADRNAADAHQTLWSMRSQAAQAALVAGDGFRGLRPLVQNLVELEAAGRTGDAMVERQRIGTVLANAPQLIDLLRFPQGTIVSSVAIAPDGKHFALATHGGGKRQVRQYDLDGRELWSTATDDLAHVLPFDGLTHGPLRYTKDGSRIVALLAQMLVIPAPTVSDAIALDARDGHVLAPPSELGHADIVWDDDARQALLRFRSERSRRFPDSGQLFDAETWQPLGPRLPHGTAIGADEWLFTPDGKRLLGSSNFTRFTLFEPATLKPQLQFELPRGDPVRAWRFTPDGGQVALGTLSGMVYLVDTRDGARTALPSAPTETIRWLEFSADGRTLVAQAEDNAIMSWDVPTRRARAAPISATGVGMNWRVLPVGDTLYSPVGDQMFSWTLAPYAPFDNTAVPGAARLRSPRPYWANGFDVHDPSRLMIATGSDGMVGLWRLPRPAVLGVRAAPLPTRHLGFDGERIVAVDGATVLLRDALTQAPRSRGFVHPENVRLAELSHDGKALVTVAGRTVRVLDLASGALRGAPIVLPQEPVRADIASAAPVLALTTAEYVGDAYRERIHVIDLEHGSLRSSEAITIARYIYGFALDPRGRYVLITAWTPPEGESVAVAAVDLESGKPRCENMAGAPGEKQVADAVIASDGETAWTYAFQKERRAQFQRWRLADCVALATIQVPGNGGQPKLMPLGDGVVAHRMLADKLVLFDGAGGRRETPGGARDTSMFEFALSADGHRAAVASRNAVQLVDLARGERSSAPLPAPIPGNDAIAKLVFSPDGTRLLARTIQGRWLLWDVPEARQSTAELEEVAVLLDRTGSDEPISDEALADLRRRLRAADVASPAASATRTLEPLALVPAADATPSPQFVPIDLGPALNVPLHGAWPLQAATGGDLPTLPFGVHRFLDVDYRVDGGVQLSRGDPATTIHPTEPESPLVAVPMLQARRVHVLAYMHIPVQRTAPSKQFARVVLIGVDGRETPLEIRTRRDVTSNYIPERAEPSARVGFFGMPTAGVRTGALTSSQTYAATFAVALEVPPGTGTIRALRLEAGDGPMEAPLFYAVTLELEEADTAQPGMRAAR